MGFGFSCQNASGYTQIDQNYANYSLAQSGFAYAGSKMYFSQYLNSPQIMVRVAPGVTIALNGLVEIDGFTPSANCEYRIYAIQSVTSGGLGMNIYGGNGSIVFSTYKRPWKVYAQANTPIQGYLPLTLPSPGFIPFIFANALAQLGYTQGRTFYNSVGATQNADGSVTFALYDQGGSGDYYPNDSSRSLLIGE